MKDSLETPKLTEFKQKTKITEKPAQIQKIEIPDYDNADLSQDMDNIYPRPNSHEINKRYNHLKDNLMKKNSNEEDLVNVGENDSNQRGQFTQQIEQNLNKKSKLKLQPRSPVRSSTPVTNNKFRSKSKENPKLFSSSANSFYGDTKRSSGAGMGLNLNNSGSILTAAFGKLVSEKSLINVLRNNFQRSLGKLNDNATKEVGFSELKTMISTHTSSDALRVYISLLSIYYENCTQSAKEIQVLLLGYISSVYRENLIDPLDKPPNLVKTVVRVTEIIQNYLKENSIVIHKACSLSLQELFDNCMPKDDTNGIILIFFDPLISIITSGSHKMSQTGAGVCLAEFITHLGRERGSKKQPYENFEKNNMKPDPTLITISEKIINMTIKTKIENQYIFEAFLNLLENLPFDNFINHLKEIYERLVFTLNNSKTSYQTKIVCLNIFTFIAKNLKNVVNLIIGYYQTEIILTLQNCTSDRVHKVQVAANEALKEWRKIEKIHEEMEKKKMRVGEGINNFNHPLDPLGENIFIDEGVKKMDKLNLLRNLSKMNKNNSFSNLKASEINKRDSDPYTVLTENFKEEIYKKGIGNVLKLSNFIKNKNNQDLRPSSSLSNLNRNKKSLSPAKQVKEDINNYLKRSYKDEEKLIRDEPEDIRETGDFNMNTKNPKNKVINLEKNEENKNHNLINDETYQEQEDIQVYHDSQEKNIIPINNNNYYINRKKENINYNSSLSNKDDYNNENQKLNLNFFEFKNSINCLFSNTYKKLDFYENRIVKKLDILDNKINTNFDKINELKNKIRQNNQNSIKGKNNINPINNCSQSPPKYLSEHNKKISAEEMIHKEMIANLKKQIDRSMSKEKDPPIIKTWKNVMKEVESKNYNNAFNHILNAQDDIYLLRLLCLTGPILDLLNVEISKKVLVRINMISRSHQIQSLLLVLIQSSFENSIFFKLNKNDQNEILETLYEYSGINSNLGSKAANLYTKITSFY
jgi:hypothetical protein